MTYKLQALYHPPQSVETFKRHLLEVHLPLVQKFPGLRQLTYGFDIEIPTENAHYFAIVECVFDDKHALELALSSPEGHAASDDVQNYATAGVTILTFTSTTNFDEIFKNEQG